MQDGLTERDRQVLDWYRNRHRLQPEPGSREAQQYAQLWSLCEEHLMREAEQRRVETEILERNRGIDEVALRPTVYEQVMRERHAVVA